MTYVPNKLGGSNTGRSAFSSLDLPSWESVDSQGGYFGGGYPELDISNIIAHTRPSAYNRGQISSGFYAGMKRKEDQEKAEQDRYENMFINQAGPALKTYLEKGDFRAKGKLAGMKATTALPDFPDPNKAEFTHASGAEGTLSGEWTKIGGTPEAGIQSVTENPAYQGQSSFERITQPWKTQQRFTPAESGVYKDKLFSKETGDQITPSEVGWGAQWDKPFQGKLSKLKLNPETGLYEKKASLGKWASALGSTATAYSEIKEKDLFKAGGKEQDTTAYLTALAPLLALTPFGWAGASTLQTATSLYDKYLEGSDFDKNLKKFRLFKKGGKWSKGSAKISKGLKKLFGG